MLESFFTDDNPNLNIFRGFMLVHTVFFWLKEGLSQDEKNLFDEKVRTLTTISTVKQGFLGTPAATEKRPVIDDSYDYSLTVIFDSLEDQNSYQVDAVHTEFIDLCAHMWERVIVYDAD